MKQYGRPSMETATVVKYRLTDKIATKIISNKCKDIKNSSQFHENLKGTREVPSGNECNIGFG